MGAGSQGIELQSQDHSAGAEPYGRQGHKAGRQWGKPQGSESYGAGPQSKQQWGSEQGLKGKSEVGSCTHLHSRVGHAQVGSDAHS